MSINAIKKVRETRKQLTEAAYAGNIGIMELIKFKQKANDEQKKKFDDHVKKLICCFSTQLTCAFLSMIVHKIGKILRFHDCQLVLSIRTKTFNSNENFLPRAQVGRKE